MSKVVVEKRIGDMLVDANLISQEQLQSALEVARRSKKKVGKVLIEEGIITSQTLAAALSYQLNIPIVDLKKVSPQPDAIRLIPEELARRLRVVPVSTDEFSLLIAMADPQDVAAITELEARAQKRVTSALAPEDEIDAALNIHYKVTDDIGRHVNLLAPACNDSSNGAACRTQDAEVGSPLAQVLDILLTQGVRDRASDIHLEPQRDRLRVRYRVDGILVDGPSLPYSMTSPLISRVKVLAGMNIAEKRRPQDGQMSVIVDGREVNLRVATVQISQGEKMVMRILDKTTRLLEIPELGLLDEQQDTYLNVLRSAYGMVLASGPTGSGKTTSLYASVASLDRQRNNIMTIEDPIEYSFDDISQIQVNAQAGITFASGLRALMRLDPDIILIGEIRDGETAHPAVQSALTGHLVLSSIHANDAPGALVRLIDLGVERFLVASAVLCVMAQRLVRKVCPYCSSLVETPPEERSAFQAVMDRDLPKMMIGSGCSFCAMTGYRSRIGVYELMVVDEGLRRIALSGGGAGETRAYALESGMVPMKRDGMLKVERGLTTPSEVMRNVFLIGT